MKQFFAFLGEVRDLGSWMTKGVVAVPLIALLADVVPPWPSKVAVTTLTSVAEVCLLMYAFEAWRKRSKPLLLKRMRRAGLAAVVLLFVYMAGLLFFTFTVDDAERGRFVIGFVYTEHAETLITKAFLGDLRRALVATGYDVERIWTSWSIQVVCLGLLTVWTAFFAALTVYIGAFVARRRR